MNIKEFLSKENNKDEKNTFLSIIIEPEWTSVGIWKIVDKAIKIVSSSSTFPWELDKELVDAVDSALSQATQKLTEDIQEISKVVLGLPVSWVENGVIKKEHLDKIKTLCSELSLSPVGFVVIPEAIENLLKIEEGGGLNAIMVGVYKENLEITVFKLGNLLGSSSVARSVSLEDDVIEGVARFSGKDFLPSRLIIYNGKDGALEEIRQTLININWEDFDNLKFLHTPKIETFDTKAKIEAVSLAGASEIANISSIARENKEAQNQDFITPIAQMPSQIGAEAKHTNQSTEIAKENSLKTQIQERQKELSEKIPFWKKIGSLGFLSSLKSLSQKAFLPLEKVLVFQGLFSLLIVFSFLFLLWIFLPKAFVKIYLSPQTIEEKINISVNLNGQEDLDSNIIAGELIWEELTSEKTKKTTGTKTVGEKAKGEIKLYRVGPKLTLSQGTIIHGPENLNFLLDETVEMASGTASSPGIATAKVTAENIGASYNLASGTQFSVANYSTSDIEAKNEEDFSGGTSREVRVVSENDQKDLKKELNEELSQKGEQNLKQKIPEDKFLIENYLKTEILSEKFDKKIGDEATDVLLNLTLKVGKITLDKASLLKLAERKLSEKIPQGFVSNNQLKFDFKLQKEAEDSVQFEVNVLDTLIPSVDTEALAKKIKGKTHDSVQNILEKEVPGFVRAEIKITRSLPGKLKLVPFLERNIEIELAAER